MSCTVTSSSRNPAARGSRQQLDVLRRELARWTAPESAPRRESGSTARPRSGRDGRWRRADRRTARPADSLSRPPTDPLSSPRRRARPPREHATRDEQREQHEPRDDRRQRGRREQASRSSACTRTSPSSPRRTARRASAAGRRWRGRRRAPAERAGRRGWPAATASAQPATRSGRASRRTPRSRPPSRCRRLPRACAAVDRGEERADAPTPRPADEIDLDAGLVQRAQHAGVIRAAVPVPVSTSAVRSRVEYDAVRGIGSDHDGRSVPASSWMRHQLHDLESAAAVRGRDDRLVSFFLVEQGAADRRGRRDHAVLGIGVFRHDELIDDQRCPRPSFRCTVEPKPTRRAGSCPGSSARSR